ncbi:MAG TPA: hypothetical protein VHF58_00055 [Solirubrobacterales bacterium]|nr:hypothetical protein [Solirubrobacterales bacterium]
MRSQRVGITVATVVFASAVLGGIANGADPPPAPVTITGEVAVGETLTATTLSSVPDQNFQWQRCDPDSGDCGDDANAPDGWESITGAAGKGQNTYTLTLADVGYLIRALGKELAEGSKWSASAAVGPVPAPQAPPAPPLDGPPPEGDPIFGQTGNVDPIKGTVEIMLPNGEVRQIQQVTQIPVGSIIDVSDGHAVLTTQRKPGGPLQSTEEWGAPFKFNQKSKNAITKLTLVHSFGDSERTVAERRGHRRGLWGRGRCRCRTSGQNSSGTARGTFYLVKETARGTVTRVKHGKVLVKNFNNGEKVLLRKGESYLAKDKKKR